MEIQSNSRQVPKIKEIVAEKYYSDILYSHLQVISSRNEEGERFFPKSVANFSNLGDTLNLTRQTISKRFKKLEELCEFQVQNGTDGIVVLSDLPGGSPFKTAVEAYSQGSLFGSS